jgi:hypothetical protein
VLLGGFRPIISLLKRQPLLTTALIAGTVDGLMGAVEDNISLALFGFLLGVGSLLAMTLGMRKKR